MSGYRVRSARMFYSILMAVLFVGIQPPQCHGQGQQSNLELNYDIDKYKYITRGEDLILTCKNKINREYVSWLYPSLASTRIVIENGINSTVTIKSAEDDVAGIYRCSVDYFIPDGYSVKIEKSINVVSVPLISIEGKIDVKVGETLTLQCIIAGGVPQPKFEKWHIKHADASLPRNMPFHGHDLDFTISKSNERWQLQNNDKDQAIGKLVIKQVHLDDAGNYTCFAMSRIGHDEKIFTVNISGGDGSEGLGGGSIAAIVIAVGLLLLLVVIYLYFKWEKKDLVQVIRACFQRE